MKVYGPYLIKSTKRKSVTIIEDNGKKTTMFYSRYLMEQSLKRELSEHEDVHHINEDKTDDRIENLEIKSSSKHITDHKRKFNKRTKDLKCPICGKIFYISGRDLYLMLFHRKRDNCTGPFCSGKCGSKYRTDVEYGRMKKLEPTPIELIEET